jgi:hypothetical protein
LIVIGTDIGLLFNFLDSDLDVATTASVVRAFRIMRIFRLVNGRKLIFRFGRHRI